MAPSGKLPIEPRSVNGPEGFSVAGMRRKSVFVISCDGDSVRLFGDKAEERHVTALLDVIANSDGAVAEAAASVHGALNLPTSGAVQMLPAAPTAGQ